MLFTMSGGGGAGLNFKVVGNPQPASPSENTIWVNTDTPITSWIFNATEPTGSDGMVWFKTGTASEASFNALKKNAVMVYPTLVKQHVGGAWADVTAKCYQNGAWNDFILIIFDGKNILPGYTFVRQNGDGSINSAAVMGDGYVQWSGDTHFGGLSLEQPIDVTDKTVVEVVVQWTGNGSGSNWKRVSLRTQFADYIERHSAVYAVLSGTDIHTVRLDVENLTGELYLTAATYNEYGNTNCRIYSVRAW